MARSSLVAQRVKRRQTKLQDETMAFLENKIQEEHLNDNAIILLLVEPGQVERNLAGLCANKIQAKYQKPCAILIRSKQKTIQKITIVALCEIILYLL